MVGVLLVMHVCEAGVSGRVEGPGEAMVATMEGKREQGSVDHG